MDDSETNEFEKTILAVVEKNVVPPEEHFWARYSPNHECSLSSVASLGLHVLVVILLIFGGIIAAKAGLGERDRPIPVETIGLERDSDNTQIGQGGDANDLSSKTGTEAVANVKDTEGTPERAPKSEPLQNANVDPVPLPEIANAKARIIEESNKALGQLAAIDKEVRKELLKGLKEGKEGSPQTGKLVANKRRKRVLRWLIDFQVSSVEDQLRQFAALGAVVAVPQPDGGFLIFRDLNRRPPMGKREDISQLNRIWFTETYKERPENVAGLAQALGMVQSPPYIMALFPHNLEEEMAKMEEGFRGQLEKDIHEQIVFQVRRDGGSYRVVIRDHQ